MDKSSIPHFIIETRDELEQIANYMKEQLLIQEYPECYGLSLSVKIDPDYLISQGIIPIDDAGYLEDYRDV
ncbi:unnamed protein product, partial [marine sediment metagenome]